VTFSSLGVYLDLDLEEEEVRGYENLTLVPSRGLSLGFPPLMKGGEVRGVKGPGRLGPLKNWAGGRE
jgi:hypothetical protein